MHSSIAGYQRTAYYQTSDSLDLWNIFYKCLPFPLKGKIAKILIDAQYSSLLYLVLPGWLEDAALFAAIDKSIGAFSWYEWPEPLKNRHLGALEDIYQKQKDFVSS